MLFASHQVVIAAFQVCGWQAHSDNQKQSCQSLVHDIKTGHAAQISDPKDSGGEITSDACLLLATCIAFQEFAALRKLSLKLLLILTEENSSSFVLQDCADLYHDCGHQLPLSKLKNWDFL